MQYNFPVKDLFEARAVLEPDFNLFLYPQLYVNLDKVRIENKFKDYRKNIKRSLNIDEKTGTVHVIGNSYKKILFTGFRGSGKTTELRKLEKELSGRNKYFTVFIELEQEYNITRFQFEDFFFILFYKFSLVLNADKDLKHVAKHIDSLIKDLISDKHIEQEIKGRFNTQGDFEASSGFNLLNLFRTKVDIKTEFAGGTTIAKVIRTKIKTKLGAIIDNFNHTLDFIRPEIEKHGKGKDILFIIDGLEKVPFEIYERLIVKDNYAIRNLNVNIITAIPIEAQYLANTRAAQDLFTSFLLPVVRVDNPENRKIMSQVITRRIDFGTFFEDYQTLDFLVKMSGGVLRQLFKLVSFCLLYAENPKLNLFEVKEIVYQYGKMMFETLNAKQIRLLKDFKTGKRQIVPANEEDGILLFNLYLLKYNGFYQINPVMEDFIR